MWLFLNLFLLMVTSPAAGLARVVIHEIHYHPVAGEAVEESRPTQARPSPDRFEFVELFNTGPEPVLLEGWSIQGGIRYRFGPGALIPASGYLVVARDPDLLLGIPAYGLNRLAVVGPYEGALANEGESLELRDAQGREQDRARFQPGAPWPDAADGIEEEVDPAQGAGDSTAGAGMGRSLEKSVPEADGENPAFWEASPWPGIPSPGRRNSTTTGADPQGRILARGVQVYRADDGNPELLAGVPLAVEWTLNRLPEGSRVALSSVVEDPGREGEPGELRWASPTRVAGEDRWVVELPPTPAGTLLRYQIVVLHPATGLQVIHPRPDSTVRWDAVFVPRTAEAGGLPACELFVDSQALERLEANIRSVPRRTTLPDPPGTPRAAWNATEPGWFVADGAVYPVRVRHHGSRYQRAAERWSLKIQFFRSRRWRGEEALFLTDKDFRTEAGHRLFQAAGLPTSWTRWIDLCINGGSPLRRLQQQEYGSVLLDRHAANVPRLAPEEAIPPAGRLLKAMGAGEDEGPYGRADGRLLPPRGPWSALDRYAWTYGSQNQGWRGSEELASMLEGFWQARGDSPERVGPDIPRLRSFLERHWDIETTLTYLALINWMSPWDDLFQNYFLWHTGDGRWTLLPWDFDFLFGGGVLSPPDGSIFVGEAGDRSNNPRGINFFKDAFFKAFREEYRRRLFVLNNTLLTAERLSELGLDSIVPFSWVRRASVNEQCGGGSLQVPTPPVLMFPGADGSIHPGDRFRFALPRSPEGVSVAGFVEFADPDRGFDAPVLRLQLAPGVEELALPVKHLLPGNRYRWRVRSVDREGMVSAWSNEHGFVVGADPRRWPEMQPGPEGSGSWRWTEGSQIRGGDWRLAGFPDSSWLGLPPTWDLRGNRLPVKAASTPLGDGTRWLVRATVFGQTLPPGAFVSVVGSVRGRLKGWVNGLEFPGVGEAASGVGPGSGGGGGGEVARVEWSVRRDQLEPGINLFAFELVPANARSASVSSLELRLVVRAPVAAMASPQWIGFYPGTPGTPGWAELDITGIAEQEWGSFSITDDVRNPRQLPLASAVRHGGGVRVTLTPSLGGVGEDLQSRELHLCGPPPEYRIHSTLPLGAVPAGYALRRFPGGAAAPAWAVSRVDLPERAPLGQVSEVRINEWLAHPLTGEDWVELYNRSGLPVDLSGCRLSDDPVFPARVQFPENTFIGPRGFLVARRRTGLDSGGWFPFGLAAEGDRIELRDRAGQLMDSVRFPAQTVGRTSGRQPDGGEVGSIPLAAPTPGGPNIAEPPRLRARWDIGGALLLELFAPPGPRYQLEQTASLAGTGWQPVRDVEPGATPNTWIVRLQAGTGGVLFRARLAP